MVEVKAEVLQNQQWFLNNTYIAINSTFHWKPLYEM